MAPLSRLLLFLAGAALALGAPVDQSGPQHSKGVADILSAAENLLPGDAIPGRYIVTFKEGLSSHEIDTHHAWVTGLQRRSMGVDADDVSSGIVKRAGYSVGSVQDSYVVEDLDHDLANVIGESPEVKAVEKDRMVSIARLAIQRAAPHGLFSISHRFPPNRESGEYAYSTDTGKDTFAYVVDTGIYTGHEDFEGRASFGFNALKEVSLRYSDRDVIGHGTHVAGIIIARDRGVARKANAISVKVFDTGDSPMSVIIRGYEWAVQDIIGKNRTEKAVINMSLSGVLSPALNVLVDRAFQNNGIVTVAAAGNKGQDASIYSPGSAESSISVGAVDESWTLASFSNYGSTVDILAPGVRVESSWISSNSATFSLNGTSMACPHVTGVALGYMSLDGLSGAALRERILAEATTGRARGLTAPDRPDTVNLVAHSTV